MKKKSILLLPLLLLGLSMAACTAANNPTNKQDDSGQKDDGGTKTVAVTGVSLNKSSLSLKVGQSETLTYTVSPAEATDKSVTWSTSRASVA